MKTDNERMQRFKEKYHLDRPLLRGMAYLFNPFYDELDFLKISNDEAIMSDWVNVYEDLMEALDKVAHNENRKQ